MYESLLPNPAETTIARLEVPGESSFQPPLPIAARGLTQPAARVSANMETAAATNDTARIQYPRATKPPPASTAWPSDRENRGPTKNRVADRTVPPSEAEAINQSSSDFVTHVTMQPSGLSAHSFDMLSSYLLRVKIPKQPIVIWHETIELAIPLFRQAGV